MVREQSKLDKRVTRRRKGLLARSSLALLAVACGVMVASVLIALMGGPVAPASSHDATLGQLVVSDSLTTEDGEPTADAGQDPMPEEPSEPVHVRLMMIGDILMHMGVIESGNQGDGTYNYDHLFAHIADDVSEADLAVLNQETILGGPSWPYSGYPTFNSPQEVGDAEVAVGFDVVLKATNHTLDLGYAGVRAELAYWAAEHPQVAVIGAADPDGEGVAPAGGVSPAGPYVFEKDGLRVALLNYTDVLNGNVDLAYDHRVVSLMSEEGIRADVAAARELADLVVVFAHWGEEYETVPVERERYWAGVFQDAGVDVVVGGHPHVIQPVEVLGEGDERMLVCWSVGNFVSTQMDAQNMVGGMVKLDFVKDDKGARLGAYEFVPTVTQKAPYSAEESAYKLCDYTDELAARSTVSDYAGEGDTRAWYVDYCARVLGEAFDEETMSVHATL